LNSDYQATPVWAWLVGRHPKKITLVFASSGGLLLGVVAVVTNEVMWWANMILFVLAFDLAAGFFSNLSHSTKTFWSSRSFLLRTSYVLAHLTVYPLVIRELVSSDMLGGILGVVLGAKILAFIIGGLRNSHPNRLSVPPNNPS